MARENPGAVLESAWHRSYAGDELRALPGDVVEVFCRCDPAVARRRYRERSGSRVAGHFEVERTDDELWGDEVNQPVGGGWPVVEVDTGIRVDVAAVAARVRAASAG